MDSLNSLRSRFGLFIVAFLWANVALLALLAVFVDHAGVAAAGGGLLVAGATAIWWRDRAGVTARIVTSIALAGVVALFVFAMQGERYQLDMHMYFFASLALITGWCDARALIAYSATVAVHHLLLNYLVPGYVFPVAEPDLARVLLHAVIVVIQTAVLLWIVIVVEKQFASADRAVAAARQAEETARLLAAQTEGLREAESRKLNERHQLAEGFIARVQDLVRHFNQSSHEVARAAGALSSIVDETSSSAQLVSDVARSALHSVQTVAAGSEELAASIAEINQRAVESAQIANNAQEEASLTQNNIRSLLDATQKIGDVLDLIRAVAAQTNLLALNATIESARAGEAGRGFAVVATEVKTLAGRTAEATDEIAEKIAEIQQASDRTAQSIAHIASTIDLIRNATSDIAAAVEQQGASSHDISRNTHRAADDAVQVTQAIVRVGENALQTGEASSSLKDLSVSLSQTAGTLESEVHRFVGELQAA